MSPLEVLAAVTHVSEYNASHLSLVHGPTVSFCKLGDSHIAFISVYPVMLSKKFVFHAGTHDGMK